MTEADRSGGPALLADEGPWRGPSRAHRGARIGCLPGGHVCRLALDGHPLDGRSFGAPGTVAKLVSLWLDERRLLDHLRVVQEECLAAPEDAGGA